MNKKWIALVFTSMLVACGGESKVGNQQDDAPIAQAGVFGSSIETSGTIEVRAGSEVLLSGQNSEGVDDPILNFKWRQVDESGYAVNLYERTRSAVVFTAPAIPLTESDGVQLDFELEVEDADGIHATDTVSVKVMPSGDRNHFLSRPLNNETYAILVVADDGVVLSEDIPITLSLSETANWIDRSGEQHSQALRTKTLRGVVPAGSRTEITDKENEYFIENIPKLDADEVNQNFQGELRDARLELELVDQANLVVDISLEQQAAGDLRVYLARNEATGLEIIDAGESEVGLNRYQFTSDWMRQQVNIESRLSAENYYKCIDPLDQATTLSDWLEAANFNGADDVYHTSYLNNYDLNFGRDMYLRTDDNGNVYTYVLNYPTLENTLTGRNEFAVVVMEFSPAPTGQCGDGTFAEQDGEKIVKFYAYVPDEASGEYVRAPSMNFDGRGERALPGVCIACHFGDANADEFNVADFSDVDASAANLNSSFMIWDLDSFLYTKVEGATSDPIYSVNEVSQEITQAYSREAQENNFRAQNQAVLHTFTYDANQLKRFEPAIKLLHGLYQNEDAIEQLDFGTEAAPLSEDDLLALKDSIDTLPGNNFDGENYVQSGWVGQEELYHRVFARNCRLCHAQIGEAAVDFDSYEEFITNERLIPYVYEQGLMPLSRLTMDRFWTDFYGQQSAAEFLRDHLNSDALPSNDVALDLLPGSPVAVVTPGENLDADADVTIDFNESVLFDATASLFSNSFQWRVDGRLVSTDDKLNLDAINPGEVTDVELVAVNTDSFLTSENISRTVLVRNNTPTIGTIPSQSMIEGTHLEFNLFDILCPGEAPDSDACRSVFGDIREGEVPSIDFIGSPTNGEIATANTSTGDIDFESTAAEAAGAASFDFTISDSFGESSDPLTISFTVNSQDGPEIIGPDTCTTESQSFANEINYPISFDSGACPDPSLNDGAADGLTLSLVSVDGSGLRDGSSVAINSGVIEYTPGRFFSGQDSFTYTVQDDSPSQKTSVGTITVTVEAQQRYSDLTESTGVFGLALGDGGCVTCHVDSGIGTYSWLNYAQVLAAATRTARLSDGGGIAVNLTEPTSTEALLDSILIKQGCNFDTTHVGGNLLCNVAGTPTQVSDLNAFGQSILQWMEEGGQNN